jgi:hypothetical protein
LHWLLDVWQVEVEQHFLLIPDKISIAPSSSRALLIFICHHERSRETLLACSTCSTNAMIIGINASGRLAIVDYMRNIRDIQTTARHVLGSHQNNTTLPKGFQVLFTLFLRLSTMQHYTAL